MDGLGWVGWTGRTRWLDLIRWIGMDSNGFGWIRMDSDGLGIKFDGLLLPEIILSIPALC